MSAHLHEDNNDQPLFVYKGRGSSNLLFIRKFISSNKQQQEVPIDVVHVTIDPTVRSIPKRSFRNCQNLRIVKIPSAVKTIGKYAFEQCYYLEEIQFHQGGGLHKIQFGAFIGCIHLTTVSLPQGLTKIGEYVFCGCSGLHTVSMPETVKSIGCCCFQDCSALAVFQFHQGLEKIEDYAFERCWTLSAVGFPLSLKVIGSSAFADCAGLLGIEFIEGTKAKIGEKAFSRCLELVNLSIPESITDLGPNVFEKCELLIGGNDDDVDDQDTPSWLWNRFSDLPVHKVCSHSLTSTASDLVQVLETTSREDLAERASGLTPFHIMATSPVLRTDILECLLSSSSYYTIETLQYQDKRGMTMMDYLLRQTSSNSNLLIRLVLQKAIVERIAGWSLQQIQRPNDLSSQLLESISSTHPPLLETRNELLDKFFERVEYSVRVEMTSLLELAVWKAKMTVSKDIRMDRASCRSKSRVAVVMDHVLGYLWNGAKLQCDTALLFFPLCSTWRIYPKLRD